MRRRIEIIWDSDQDDLLNHEINWLKRCLSYELRGRISKYKIVFTIDDSYLVCTPSKSVRKDIPDRFLENNQIITNIAGYKVHNGFFIRLDLVFWFLHNVHDVWNYRKLVDRFIDEVYQGNYAVYNQSKDGYIVLKKYLAEVQIGWTPIEMTLFLGYLQYLGIFEKSTFPPLGIINQELKNGIMQQISWIKNSKNSLV